MKKIVLAMIITVISTSLFACGSKADTDVTDTEEVSCVGTWIEEHDGRNIVIFEEDGHGRCEWTKTWSVSSADFSWENNDGTIQLTSKFKMDIPKKYTIENNDGKVYLVGEGFKFITKDTYFSDRQVRLGDKVNSNRVEFVLKSVEFADKIFDTGVDRFLPGGSLSAGKDNSYLCMAFDIKNVGKDRLKGDEVEVILDYNDGYCYSDNDVSTMFYCVSRGAESNGSFSDFAPLEHDEVRVAFKVPAEIGEDKNSPIKIIVSLISDDGHEVYEYEIR